MLQDFNDLKLQWLKEVISPIENEEGLSAGEDPRYSDLFSKVKSEIESKSGSDYSNIVSNSIEILTNEGKDLRVGGYLLFAVARLQGVEGLTFGFDVLSSLIKTFENNIYPQKQQARQVALSWIAQERIVYFLDKYSGTITLDSLSRLDAAYNNLCKTSESILEDRFNWKKLTDWLDKNIKLNTLTAKKEDNSSELTSDTIVNENNSKFSGSMLSNAEINEIQSDTHLTQVVRNLLNYYKRNQQYGVYAALSRSVRWANLKIPPANNSITRIPAPLTSDLSKIENLIEQGQWMDAWLACEDAFMSPGGLFYLDYQRLAHQCAQRAGLNEVTQVIESHLLSLLKRLPKLTSLKFVDESSFVSNRLLGWVEQTIDTNSIENNTSQDYLSDAREQLRDSGLTSTLKWLDEQPVRGRLERFKIKLIQAQLCIEEDKSGLALPLLNKLSNLVLKNKLQSLDPSFSLQVWRQLQFAVESQLQSTRGAEEKAKLKKQLQRVNHLICSTDITIASQWL